MSAAEQFSSESVIADTDPSAPSPPAAARQWGYGEVFILAAVGIMSNMLATAAFLQGAERLAGLEAAEAAELLLTNPFVAVPVQVAVWIAPLLFVGFVVSWQCRMPLRRGLAWNRPPRPVTSYLRMGVLLAFASILASVAIGEPDQQSPMMELFARRDGLFILAVYGIFLAPFAEEVVFRGFLFAPLRRYHGNAVALLMTSVVFTALHGAQYGWQWQRLAVLMGVGSVLCLIRIRSGSVKASAVAHAAYNALLFLGVLAVQPG